MSIVRPLLERYQHRREELSGLLSRAQASASSATAEARELSRGHLGTFGRLEESCGALARELERAADADADAAVAGEDSGRVSSWCSKSPPTAFRIP